ncbi:B12-binding domain-containing radical SAM protein [candidate division CSSED10-310 bacterium]|uniref:B12-binding domain-containing radical SAM protein n=1 Tax=candidate division CSSED10-310 bacterium TaxID=2855610 RepID=A0ABV6Z2S8_UNCC1
MKFLIIFPDWGYFPLSYRRTIPPLSPAILAGILRHYGDVQYIDERLQDIPFDAECDVVFISAMTNQVQRAYHIAEQFRKKGITVALGGVHASLLPGEAAQHADAVFVGEVEENLHLFLRDFKTGQVRAKYQCQNLDDETAVHHVPDRTIYPGKGYLPLDPIMFFRGCRLSCEACSVPQTQGKTVIFSPIADILTEIQNAQDYLFFINDDLYFHRSKIIDILTGMVGMKKNWLGLGSAEMARDETFLKLMKDAGCWLLYLDFGPREAIALNNPQRASGVMKQLQDRLARFSAQGLKIIGSFTFGYDFDTPAIFDNTLEFCVKNNIDEAEFHLLVPYPRTRLAQKWEQDDRLVCYDWQHYTATEVVFTPKNMSASQLHEGYLKAWRTFYQLPVSEEEAVFDIKSFRAFPTFKPDKAYY